MGHLKSKDFLFGFFLCAFLVGCAGASFPYRFYGLSEMDYSKGKLLGPKSKDDILFEECRPSANLKNPCVIMKTATAIKLKQEHLDLQNRLNECLRPKVQSYE